MRETKRISLYRRRLAGLNLEILSSKEMPWFSAGCICSSAQGNILKLMVIIIAVTLHRLWRCSRTAAVWHRLHKQCTCLTKHAFPRMVQKMSGLTPINAGQENTEGLNCRSFEVPQRCPLIMCLARLGSVYFFCIPTTGRGHICRCQTKMFNAQTKLS